MKNEMEKHQYGFGFMRWDTGGERVHSFWGVGATEEECKQDARRQAEEYRRRYESELNEKARRKAESRGDRYAPSRIGVALNGCSLWR